MFKNFFDKHPLLLKCLVLTRNVAIALITIDLILNCIIIYSDYTDKKAYEERHNKATIFAMLPTDNEQANKAFNERIQHTYPVGGDVKKMIADLTEQGFQVSTNYKRDSVPSYNKNTNENEYTLTFNENNTACIVNWTVEGKSTATGTIIEISAFRSVSCH